MRVFLLEGPDGAGKTTTAKQLADMFGGQVVHFSQPTTNSAWIEYGRPVMTAYNQAQRDGYEALIIDRLHISEYIYGPIFRGRVLGKRVEYRAIEQLLDMFGTTRLYISPGWKTIQRRFQERGDDFVNLHQNLQIHRAYLKLLSNDPKWHRIDNAGQTLLGVLSK